MKRRISIIIFVSLLGIIIGSGFGCARRMNVATATTIGLHATPGDGQSQPPQVTLAYKRAETALIPTAGKTASKQPVADAFSALAVIDFRTRWFGETAIDQFIGTGIASREIQQEGSEFTRALADGGARDFIIAANVYAALRARSTDNIALARVRELDALSELVPDEYTWLEVTAAPDPPAPLQVRRRHQRRAGPQNYTSFTTYRQNVIGSINALTNGATLAVTELDNSITTLTGDDLQRELARQQTALDSLRRRAADTGATSRALNYYMETLKQ